MNKPSDEGRGYILNSIWRLGFLRVAASSNRAVNQTRQIALFPFGFVPVARAGYLVRVRREAASRSCPD